MALTVQSSQPTKTAAKLDSRKRHCLLVLGMHRSGTSALARVLSLLGAELPETLMPANIGNETGHWESQAIADFNDKFLAAAGTSWDDWLAVNPMLDQTPQWVSFKERARSVLRSEYADAPMFVMKDPRLCRIAGFWLEVLDAEQVEADVVIPFRNPVEVVASLANRDRIDDYFGLLLWLRHLIDAERATRGRRRIFTEYDQLLGDWQDVANKIAARFDLIWPRLSPRSSMEIDAFLQPVQRHHQAARTELRRRYGMSTWFIDTFDILSRWARDGESAEDHATLDQIAAAFDNAAPMFAKPILAAHDNRMQTGQLEAEVQRLSVEQGELLVARDQLSDTASAAQERIAELDVAIAGLRDQLAATAGERDSLLEAMDRAAVDFAATEEELRHQLALTTSTLRQREEEIAQLETRGNTLAAEAEALHARLGALQQAVADGVQARAASEAEGEDLRCRIEELDQDIMTIRAETAAAATAHKTTTGERDEAIAQCEAAIAERDAARRDHATAKADVAERFTEIARMTQLLRSSEEAAERGQDDAEWLRQIGAVMASYPRWWALLPRHVRQQKEEARLGRKDLFDADAYRARYPDVDAAGMAPLRHYLLYGMREGRAR